MAARPAEETLGRPGPPGPDDRRLLHDPVRGGRRSADRHRLPPRRLRDHWARRRTSLVDNSLFNLPDPDALGLDHALFGSGFLPTWARCSSPSARPPSRFFIPALAGYIAYAIADRPGIAPGFVMGGLAANLFDLVSDGVGTPPPVSWARSSEACSPAWSRTGSPGWKVPTWARGLMPVLVIPLLHHTPAGLHHDRRARPAVGRAHGGAERRPDPMTGPAARSCSASSSA